MTRKRIRTKPSKRKRSLPRFPSFPRFWLLGPASLALFTHAYTTLTGTWATLALVDSQTAFLIGVLESLILPFILGLFLGKIVVWIHDRPHESTWFSDPGILD